MSVGPSPLEPGNLEELMTRDPVTLEPEESLDVARSLMLACRIRHLPVVWSGQLCGMVSARDLAGVSQLHDTPVREVMHGPVETLGPEDTISVAAERLLARRFSSLPVLQHAQLIGIVTSTDLVRAACSRLREQPTAQLMTPRPLVTVEPEEPLLEARLLMKERRIRHLPVLRKEELIGFVSDLDLLAAAGPTVADAVAPYHRVTADSHAVDAGRLMVRDRLDALPVVADGRLVGVLSAFDFLRYLIA